MAGYAEIASHYRGLIRSGELRPGDRLPTQRQVAQDWEVANQTVRRAFQTLKAEGLTTATTGGGTVVAESGSASVADRVATHAATGRALARNETSTILEIASIGVDATVAVRLDVEPGTPVHMRRRLVTRDNVPVHMSTSYYPSFVVEAAPELLEPVSTGGSRELVAERLRVAQDQAVNEVTSRQATDLERDALGFTGSATVTQVLRTVFLTDGRVIEVAVKVTSGARPVVYTEGLNGGAA